MKGEVELGRADARVHDIRAPHFSPLKEGRFAPCQGERVNLWVRGVEQATC